MKKQLLITLIFLSITSCGLYAKTINTGDPFYKEYKDADFNKKVNKFLYKEGKISKKKYKKRKEKCKKQMKDALKNLLSETEE